MRVIAGSKRGIQLKTPNGMATRPTADRVKEALFSILHFDLPGAVVLDLFAGTGQLGIEALSRGAQRTVFVDQSKEACGVIQENIRKTGFAQASQVLCCDYLSYLKTTKEKFNIILLDPPYAEAFLENSVKLITEIDILQSGGIIVTERPAEKAFSFEFSGYQRSKDYKYGNTILTLFQKL